MMIKKVQSAFARTLCTAAEPLPIKRRLSKLPVTGGTVIDTLNEYVSEGNRICKFILGSCVRGLRFHRRYLHALQVMEWMELRNENFSYKDHAVRLDLVAKVHGVDDAEKYFNALAPLEKNKFTYGALLNCYCQEKQEEKALSLFQKMEAIDVISTLAFNNLISLYMKIGQPEKVPGLVKEMREKDIPLQTFTYNVLIHSHGCVGDIEGMERVYEEMLTENENNGDWTTYSNLAVQYIQAGLFEKARSALKRLEEEMRPHDRSAHHFLISLYANISDLGEVYRIWSLMKSDLKMLNSDYLVILHALERLNDVDGMKSLYSEWELSWTIFDVRIPNIAIKFYLDRDMITEAETVLHEAIKRSTGRFFKSWELFVEFFLRKRNMSSALKCLEAAISRVKDHEWKPRSECIGKFLDYFEEERDVSGVEELCKMLEKINCLDSTVYLSLFRTYIAAGKTVDDIRKRIDDYDIEINDELQNFLQNVCPNQSV